MPYPAPADIDAIKKDPNITILEQPGLNVGYLAYQTTKKPFDDVRVRKAFNMAFNKKAIIGCRLSLDRHRGQEPDPTVDVVV
jgi:dipeptide transport system substrate-binding protein